jgi:sugar/nucleoside kinase (ribokinase family)
VGLVERNLDRLHVGFFGLGPGDAAAIDHLEQVARARGRLFVVTLGPAGSVALGPEGRMHQAALPVPHVADTTGAGDTFAAGFLLEYCRSKDVARSLASGARVAASSVQRVGAFPWEDEA